jgi:hypothetical protein
VVPYRVASSSEMGTSSNPAPLLMRETVLDEPNPERDDCTRDSDRYGARLVWIATFAVALVPMRYAATRPWKTATAAEA